jgi:uncharacterized protein YegP (UPF0339 family)
MKARGLDSVDRCSQRREKWSNMSGHFEVFAFPEGGYRFRLLDSAGNHLASSGAYPTKHAAAAGILTARGIAGTGLISNVSGDQVEPSSPDFHARRWSPAH